MPNEPPSAKRWVTAAWLPAFLLGLVLLLLFPANAPAEYFGRNKVQHESFHFEILRTPHFDIYFYPEEQEVAGLAARMAERWYLRHSAVLDDSLHGRQPIILYASFPQFEETNVVQGIGAGTGGVTESALRRVVLPSAGPLAETDHVIGHELVHAFQYDITGHGRYGSRGMPGANRLPLWFIEGMAEYLSIGPVDPNTAMWMRETTLGKIPKVTELGNSKYFPYRYGQALLAYIGGRWGDQKIGQLLRLASMNGDVYKSIDSVLAIKPDSLSKDWHKALHAQYDSLAAKTLRPKDYGRRLIEAREGRGDLNVSPSISPDGNSVVFFSSRNNYSIDLYLADANTGEIKKTLYKTAMDSHLEGLEFITSAGSWGPADRFVFSGVRHGRPTLQIIDTRTGKRDREIPFPKLGQILSPAWSPDGNTIAFSAVVGGLSDLFLYDLRSKELRRLTHDPFADLMPAWSPDGKRIAFVTDRFTTDLGDLSFGRYRIASIESGGGPIRNLTGFDGADNINPQWSADGSSLFFISNRGGIANIYRADLDSGRTAQITNFFGGVSGITSLSPAMTVAARSQRLVYSDFEDGKYGIWEIDRSHLEAPSPPAAALSGPDPAALPPEHRREDSLVQRLRDPVTGLPADTSEFTVDRYHPRFKLLGAGQTSIGAQTGPFGTAVGGGLSLYFTDMLGNRNLQTAFGFQSGGGISAFTGLLGYFNTGHRTWWGGEGAQVPYISTASTAFAATRNGQPVYVEQDYLYRETDRSLNAAILHPFSQTTRVELSAGFLNVSFRQQLETITYDSFGNQVSDVTQDLPVPSSINLGTTGAALVYDNSVMGATSPILGRRSRLEVSPNFGTLRWTDLLADVREYFMPVRPITLAGRVLHYGRYGPGGDNILLSPLYLGYPGLVRGYNGGFLSNDFPTFGGLDSTTISDPTYGSRLIVANAELRFPLFGLLHIGRGYFGMLPVEAATFYDTGVAWHHGDKPRFEGGDRPWISSWGQALRMNLFGYAVGEVDYVRPLNGPDQKWRWQFNLVEGF